MSKKKLRGCSATTHMLKEASGNKQNMDEGLKTLLRQMYLKGRADERKQSSVFYRIAKLFSRQK